MSFLRIVEVLATATSLGYLLLLMRQHKGCWPLAIVSAALSVYLFVASKLYAEALLYGYYILIAIYGWWHWSRPGKPLKVTDWPWKNHLFSLAIGGVLSLGLGHMLKTYTDADLPFLDATTTIFSFIASIMEAKKVLSGWLYWIVINAVTAGLYFSKSLDIYAALMGVYFVMSILGYYKWRQAI